MARGPITFRDVVTQFFPHEWEFDPLQKKPYQDRMMENYSNFASLGHFIPQPDIIVLLEQGKDPWMVVGEETRRWNTNLDSSYKIISDRKTFVSGKHSSLFLHQRIHSGEKVYEGRGKAFCCMCLKPCSTGKGSCWSRQSGLQDGVSCATKGEETPRCQIKGAAKLDTNVRFYPQRHCWNITDISTSIST